MICKHQTAYSVLTRSKRRSLGYRNLPYERIRSRCKFLLSTNLQVDWWPINKIDNVTLLNTLQCLMNLCWFNGSLNDVQYGHKLALRHRHQRLRNETTVTYITCRPLVECDAENIIFFVCRRRRMTSRTVLFLTLSSSSSWERNCHACIITYPCVSSLLLVKGV